jgi:hypothetical protein
MPRSARLDTPDVLHHIMIRGIERRRIFIDNEDREDFLTRLGKLLPDTKTSCYAWAFFILNHAHFLFRIGKVLPLESNGAPIKEPRPSIDCGRGSFTTIAKKEGVS